MRSVTKYLSEAIAQPPLKLPMEIIQYAKNDPRFRDDVMANLNNLRTVGAFRKRTGLNKKDI